MMPRAALTETEEEAEARRQQQEQQREKYQAEQERRAEARRLEKKQREQEYEAERTRREELRQTREATFERILENAAETLAFAQLRVLLRAIVNLDPYTFADDLAEEVADDNERRSREEVLLATIDATADEKLTQFAVRLVLSGRVGVPRENELDLLTEAESPFLLRRKRIDTEDRENSLRPIQAQGESEEADSSEETDCSLTRSGSQPSAPAHFPEK